MLVVPSPKSHSTEVIGPWDVLLNSTIRGALPESTSTENEAEGGTGVGPGMGVAVGVAVGVGVEVGESVGATGFGARLGVAVGASNRAGDVGASGIAVAAGVSDSPEGIMEPHADMIARVNVNMVRNMNCFFFTFGAPGILFVLLT